MPKSTIICAKYLIKIVTLILVGESSSDCGLDTGVLRLTLGVECEAAAAGCKTSILNASSSSSFSLLVLRLGINNGVGAGDGHGVGTSLIGLKHLPYSMLGISSRIVGRSDDDWPPVKT